MELDFLATAGFQSAPVAALNHELVANGLSTVERNDPAAGFILNFAWKRAKLGLSVRGVPHNLSYGGHDKELQVHWSEAGLHIGFDILRARNFTTFVQAESAAGSIILQYKDFAPGFVPIDGSTHTIGRDYQGVGFGVGHDFYFPFWDWTAQNNVFAFLIGVRFSRFFQLHQDHEWTFRLGNDKRGVSVADGPPLHATGWRFELHAGLALYDF